MSDCKCKKCVRERLQLQSIGFVALGFALYAVAFLMPTLVGRVVGLCFGIAANMLGACIGFVALWRKLRGE